MNATKTKSYAILRPKFVCKAPDCKNDTFNRKDIHFFPFPDDKERCQVWLALSGRHDLMNDTQSFNKFNKLCAEHFEADQFEDLDRSILIDTAVPTIFGFSEASTDLMETESVQGEVSEYIPECLDVEEQAVIDLPDDNSTSVDVEEVPEFKVQVKNIPLMATYSAQKHKQLQQLKAKTITTTVAGQKRILMAVPKEMYMSAVKSGKIPLGKSIDSDQLKALPNITNSATTVVDQTPLSLLRKRLSEQSEAAKQSKSNDLPTKKQKFGVTRSLTPIPLPRVSPPLPEEPRVYQVAPELPVQAQPVTVANFDWSTLMPDGWQDWPVPTDVFLASAVQLKNNYLKLFPKKDRIDIETTLHLASNYKNLSIESKAHIRSRVHHYLKILQLEKSKLNIPSENNENNEN